MGPAQVRADVSDPVGPPRLHHEPLGELVDARPVEGELQVVGVARAIEDQPALPWAIATEGQEEAVPGPRGTQAQVLSPGLERDALGLP